LFPLFPPSLAKASEDACAAVTFLPKFHLLIKPFPPAGIVFTVNRVFLHERLQLWIEGNFSSAPARRLPPPQGYRKPNVRLPQAEARMRTRFYPVTTVHRNPSLHNTMI